MALFPALNPSSRTYTPGSTANTSLLVLSGDEVNVRHGNGRSGDQLRMTFSQMTRAEHYALLNHYAFHGRFEPFDLNATTLAATNLTFPANHQWIYTDSPSFDETCDQINGTVSLTLIPPYLI
jgi:hypothetical protein